MEMKIAMLIITGLSVVAWSLLFYSIKKHDRAIETNEKQIQVLSSDIRVTNSKLWDEDKIMKKIEDSVYHAVTKAENQRLKAENDALKNKEK